MYDEENVRLDKWLWAARFYKTRALAKQAIEGGKIKHNENKGKPSKVVCIGDQLEIKKGVDVFVIHVLGLSDKRGSASQAQKLYEETKESIEQREVEKGIRKNAPSIKYESKGRPTKRDRRQIIKLKKTTD